MNSPVLYRPFHPGEETAVCAMVERCFNRFVAPGYSAEGRQAFLNYASAKQMAKRQQAGHFVLVAECDGVIAGMIEVRGNDHISLLFVDEACQGRGISRELTRRALDLCRQQQPDLRLVTVNSSPYAVPVYERLGFRAAAPEHEANGIRFTPMILEITP